MQREKQGEKIMRAGEGSVLASPDSPTAPTGEPVREVWSYEDTHDANCGHPCTVNGCHEGHPSGRYVVDGPEWDDDYLFAGIPAIRNREHARLIAAAPELLAALKAFAGVFDVPLAQRLELMGLAINDARAAIAKAEGR